MRMDRYSRWARRLAGAEGLELSTSGFGDRRSSQLSYAPAMPASRPARRPGTGRLCKLRRKSASAVLSSLRSGHSAKAYPYYASDAYITAVP